MSDKNFPPEESKENNSSTEQNESTASSEAVQSTETQSVLDTVNDENKKITNTTDSESIDENNQNPPDKIEESDSETISEISSEDKNSDSDDEEISSSDDEDSDDEKEEKSQKDYSNFSKKQLISELTRLLKEEKIQDIKQDVEEIRSEFNSKFNEELEQKKEEFLADGGNIIDFHYSTPLRKEFNSLYFDYKEKRNNYYKNLKKNLQENLNKRWDLIEELKGLLNAEENINSTYKHFKEIQEKWHTAGPIPRDKYNTVWNTYHHHVENFYDFLHLNREFRDLDFKHNLEAKLKLITRAEELAQEADVNKAFRELQMLHKTWKEDLGPVSKEYREEVWDKFSAATKVIHDRRQELLEQMEEQYQDNYEAKMQLINSIAEISESQPTNHKGWQNAIQKVQELRDNFFEIGRVPRSKNKEIWKSFKEITRSFNQNKNKFYKNQKKEQLANLDKKRELIAIAEQNKDSEDFEVVTPLMKKIQSDWKKIGHVPRKDSDKIWKEFKNACNHYFDRLHAKRNKGSEEEIANLEAKKSLLESASNTEITGNRETDLPIIKQYISEWKNIGRVPSNQRNIEQKFNKVLDGLFAKLDLGKKEKELIKFDNKLNALVNQNDERQLQNEHFYLSKRIDEIRDEIRQLENNLGFFHNVDKNNALVKEVYKNIDKHKDELEVLKAKLSKIKEIREE